MVKQSNLGISNRTTVTERCRIDESVQRAELIDCRRNNLFGRVSLVEISRYEGGLRSQLQNLVDGFSAALPVTTGKNDCRRARACGFQRDCSPHALRCPSHEQHFVINTNVHFSFLTARMHLVVPGTPNKAMS